jgi:hypothetical protein
VTQYRASDGLLMIVRPSPEYALSTDGLGRARRAPGRGGSQDRWVGRWDQREVAAAPKPEHR